MLSFFQSYKIGILGGGQLGRMLIQAAIDYPFSVHVLDPSGDAPSRPYAHHFTQGSLTDYQTVYQFGQQVDLLTIEIENVNTEALAQLKAEGKTVYPDPDIIRLIQDKREQKQFFAVHNLPTAPFHLVDGKEDIKPYLNQLPLVNKLGRAGYDGRGVKVLKDQQDVEQAFDAPGIVEQFIPFEKELSVIVARNPQGEIAVFPVVEMVFHPEQNLVEYLMAPADIKLKIAQQAQQLAKEVVARLEYVGVMAVEMFLTKGKELLINELAPRPHNSGHHTIRANFTSQYEQHLRAILGYSLGATDQMTPAAVVNLLGEPGFQGPAQYQGLQTVLRIPGVYPHIYGKAETRPFRKMGHVTILDADRKNLRNKADQVKALLKVVSDSKIADPTAL